MGWKWFDDLKANAKTRLAKFNNSTFKNASMAATALIAAADGKVDPTEKSKVVKLIQNNELLQVFNAQELGQLFLTNCDKAADEFARLDLLTTVRKLRGDADASDNLLKICLIIAGADGNVDESEKKVFTEIAQGLSKNAADYLS